MRTRLGAVNQEGYPEFFGGRQTSFIVIHEQRSRRIEPQQALTVRPILRPHLEIADLKGIHNPVDVAIQTRLGGFDGHTRRMGVRHDGHMLPEPPKMAQKLLGTGQEADHVIEFFVHRHHVDTDPLRPVVQVRPCQFAFDRSIHRHQSFAGFFKRKSM